ncbi:MAG: Eco57I restriction-modification methylase domain-containing protein [Thermosipho sp. (in: Bacteria)]|nr:Eco57I restriction-modification methylase domain-containing protein [Thermosipho sp. (in: thermotogales)]
MNETIELLISIVNDFSLDKFKRFFRKKSSKFKPDNSNIQSFDESFKKGMKLGEIELEDDHNIIICAFESDLELSEKSSKRKQYEIAKKTLKNELKYDAGLFIFYDKLGNFRISLVYEIPQGKKRTFNHFKRFTFFVSKGQPYHTFLKQIGGSNFKSLESIKEAFSVEKVTEEFFEAYKYALNKVIIPSLSDYEASHQKKHSFAQQLLSRILFIYFLQRKGWFKWRNYEVDINYIKNLWLYYKKWKKENNTEKDKFYSVWLSSLFFGAFNKQLHLIHNDLPEDIKESYKLMPYLNGGLFLPNELDELGFDLPDNVFEWLFEPDENSDNKYKGFLEIFNFTIDESKVDDSDVAIDPEMLGHVYESLIAEEERGTTGIFYTPKVEIDFMCRLSLANYLKSGTNIPKEKLIGFVFEPHNKSKELSIEELRIIKDKLNKVKIVDPAVGSASFLVGMMNILVELHSELTELIEGKEENLFALKEKIILENLYGVDVKDWAVMVGELRLWLSLIIETEEKYMDIYNKPLLPNLSFKIRQGDSLIQEIADVYINLKNEMLNIPSEIKNKMDELIDKKVSFFSGKQSSDLNETKNIEKFEQNIFKEIIQFKISETNNEIKELEEKIKRIDSQVTIHDQKNPKDVRQISKLKKEIENLEINLEKYYKILNNLGNKTQKDYFLWELDFIEVFSQKGGFDIVIGNPPYVRQELIAPPLENQNNYTDDQWRKIKKRYKEKLIQSVKNIWNSVEKVDKKSDLYVYFYYQGLSLLRPGGIFCFINSNSWLDVGYGVGLQEFLLKNMQPLLIIDNLKKRSFKYADINTVIVLIKKPVEKLDDFTLKFVAFKKPFENVLKAEVIRKIEMTDKPLFDDEDFRLYPKTKNELLLEGVEISKKGGLIEKKPEYLPYIGNKWGGKYLRAPEIYFKILERGKDKLIRLGDIAEVKRGFTTGANKFFYLKPIGITVKEVAKIAEKNPNALIRVKNDNGWEGEIEAKFLRPVIKSPKELKTIIVKIEDLNYLVFMCHKSKQDLEGTKALEYIEYGEKQGYHERQTCKSRERWWNLGKISSMVLSKRFIDSNFAYFINPKNYFTGDTFFVVSCFDWKVISAFLNSTCGIFFTEIYGRKNMGEGVLLIYGPEILQIPVFKFSNAQKKIVENLFNLLSERKPKSIFDELGFDLNKPIREQEPNPLPDRKALDNIIFNALGLTEKERKEVYWAIAELVKDRLEKAGNV